MQNFLISMLTCSVAMSILSLLYMAATPFLERYYSEKGRYYVWLIITIGFIIPFRPHFSSSIVKVTPTETTMPVIQLGNATPIIPRIEIAAHFTASPSISWWHIVAVVWLAGMIVFLAYHTIKHYRLMKIVRRWSDVIVDEQAYRMMQDMKADLGISKPIGLLQCESIGSPMLVGFINPRILLPSRDFAQDDLSFIIKHELVHYKRKDLWFKLLLLVATAIHWFNPIVYLMAKVVDALCEISCDVEVIRNSDVDTRQHYSEAIISVIQYQSKLKTAFSTNFYGGKNGMKKRIFSIMDTSQKRVGTLVICAALLLTLGTGAALAVTTNAAAMPEVNTPANVLGNEQAAAMEQEANAESGNHIYNAIIVMENGEELDLGDFTTKEDAYDATKQYCSEQIGLGNMSQHDADGLLESMSQQWDSWSETVTG